MAPRFVLSSFPSAEHLHWRSAPFLCVTAAGRRGRRQDGFDCARALNRRCNRRRTRTL